MKIEMSSRDPLDLTEKRGEYLHRTSKALAVFKEGVGRMRPSDKIKRTVKQVDHSNGRLV
jgi:hypothetical protein